jgi:hypothetical protein
VSGTPVGPDWNGALRLFWSFLWRLAALSAVATLVLGLTGILLVRGLGMAPKSFAMLGSVASPVIFFVLQIEAFRRLAAAYDIRTHGGHSGEQNRRHRR